MGRKILNPILYAENECIALVRCSSGLVLDIFSWISNH